MSSPSDETLQFTPRFDASGLITCLTMDATSREILMVAYMNREALEETLRTKRAVYYSRSRQKLWRKGEESGNWQELVELRVDCDQDCLQIFVNQIGGAACHTGRRSCFYRRLSMENASQGQTLEFTDQHRVFDPATVYAK